MLIDTHAHLNMPDYTDLSEVLTRAEQADVKIIINVSFDLAASQKSLQLAQDIDNIYAAIGIHPHDAETVNDETLKFLKEKSSLPKVVAIGETGLDYYKNLSPKEAQKEAFRKQLALAQEVNLPVIVHSRDAHKDSFLILKEENKGNLRGVMHCYAAGLEYLQDFIDLGFYFSFGGPVTYPKANDLRETVKAVPLERLLLETDSPYLTPQAYRGKRNEPAYLKLTAEKIAEVKGISYEELAFQTTKNARALFTKIL